MKLNCLGIFLLLKIKQTIIQQLTKILNNKIKLFQIKFLRRLLHHRDKIQKLKIKIKINRISKILLIMS
jgi:hypothetical protein